MSVLSLPGALFRSSTGHSPSECWKDQAAVYQRDTAVFMCVVFYIWPGDKLGFLDLLTFSCVLAVPYFQI